MLSSAARYRSTSRGSSRNSDPGAKDSTNTTGLSRRSLDSGGNSNSVNPCAASGHDDHRSAVGTRPRGPELVQPHRAGVLDTRLGRRRPCPTRPRRRDAVGGLADGSRLGRQGIPGAVRRFGHPIRQDHGAVLLFERSQRSPIRFRPSIRTDKTTRGRTRSRATSLSPVPLQGGARTPEQSISMCHSSLLLADDERRRA